MLSKEFPVHYSASLKQFKVRKLWEDVGLLAGTNMPNKKDMEKYNKGRLKKTSVTLNHSNRTYVACDAVQQVSIEGMPLSLSLHTCSYDNTIDSALLNISTATFFSLNATR